MVSPSAAVYCRWLFSNAITAIPGGLLIFTTALSELYGRPRPTMGSAAHLHRHSGRPATLGNRIALNSPYTAFPPGALIDLSLHFVAMPTVCAAADPCVRLMPPSSSPPDAAAVAWFRHRPRYTAGT